MALYKDPKSILQAKLNEVLSEKEETIISDLMELALLKEASTDIDLITYAEVYKLLGLEKFTALVSLLNGRDLKMPNIDDFKDSLLMIISYYYKNEGKSWDQIKSILGYSDINSIKLGIQSSQFEKFLQKMNKRILNEQKSKNND